MSGSRQCFTRSSPPPYRPASQGPGRSDRMLQFCLLPPASHNPKTPCHGEENKDILYPEFLVSWKNERQVSFQFYPSLFLNKSVAWCILDDFLMKQIFMLLLFSCSLSSSLGPHGGLLCLLPSPGVCSNSCPIDFIQSTILKEQCNTLCEYTSNKFLFRWKDKEHVTNTLIM